MTNARTNWLALLLVGLAAFVPVVPDARANTTSGQTPQASAPAGRPAPPERYYPQNETFQTAAEQAVYVGYYQQQLGPYGKHHPDGERNIREAAEAIQDCISNRDCNPDKQQKVVRALVQYNQGQALKAFMVKNTTNAERMKTAGADSTEKGLVPSHNRNVGETINHRFQVAGQGLDVRDVRSGDSRAPASEVDPEKTLGRGGLISRQSSGSSRARNIDRGHGTARPDYFQLSDDALSAEKVEVFGPEFVNNYRGFIQEYASTKERDRHRYYRWVESRPNIYTIAGSGELTPEDEARFNNAVAEQNLPQIRKAVEDYQGRIRMPDIKLDANGKPIPFTADEERYMPRAVGDGDMASPNAQQAELNAEGRTEQNDRHFRFRAASRYVNQKFRETHEENRKQRNAARAGGKADPSIRDLSIVSLSPDSFDNFLDKIWPSSVKRAEIMARIPASQPAPAAPASGVSAPAQTTAGAASGGNGQPAAPSSRGGGPRGYNGGGRYDDGKNRGWPYGRGRSGSGTTNSPVTAPGTDNTGDGDRVN